MTLARTAAAVTMTVAATAALALVGAGVANALPARPQNACDGIQGSLHTITHWEFDLGGNAVGETAYVCVYWNNGEGAYESLYFDKDGTPY